MKPLSERAICAVRRARDHAEDAQDYACRTQYFARLARNSARWAQDFARQAREEGWNETFV